MPFFEHQKFRTHYEAHEGLVPHDTLCIHGNLASNIWWQPTIELLRAQANPDWKGRLICAEWRGCGKSSGLSEESELNLPALADDYNELLAHLGAKNVSVIGHSTGGLIAIYCLQRAPDRYSRALLLNPVCATGIKTTPERTEGYLKMSRDRAYCREVMATATHGGFPDPALGEKIIDDAFGVHPLVWTGVPRMLHEVDIRSELPKVTQPVLVLHGDHDWVLPIEESKQLAAALPRGSFLELKDRGHSCNLENAPLFVSHINKFLFG